MGYADIAAHGWIWMTIDLAAGGALIVLLAYSFTRTGRGREDRRTPDEILRRR